MTKPPTSGSYGVGVVGDNTNNDEENLPLKIEKSEFQVPKSNIPNPKDVLPPRHRHPQSFLFSR
ncbi:hypothetical protein ABIC84_000082 [Mucilaginibacter sp. 3215]